MQPRGYSHGPAAPQVHLSGSKGGSVCSLRLLTCTAPLLSPAAGWEPSTRARNRRTFMPPPPRARAPGPCFLFIPCGRDSMGRNSAPCPTAGTQTSILRRGSRDTPRCRGRGQGCYKELIVSWGPRSKQGLGSNNSSQPEPCGAAGGKRGAGVGSGLQARGEGARGGLETGGGACPPLTGYPVLQPTRNMAFWKEQGCSLA